MKTHSSESPADVWNWFLNQAKNLEPALLGSLSLRRTRCIRPNCSACASGEQPCQLRPVRPAEETTVRRLRSRRTRARSTSLLGSRASSRGTALPDRTSLCPSSETRAGQVERIRGRRRMPRTTQEQISFADWELLQQGIELEPVLQNISDFLDNHAEMVEAVRQDLERGLKNPRAGRSRLSPSQVLRSLTLRKVLERTRKTRSRNLLTELCIGELRKEIDRYCKLGDRVIDQARRRVLEGEQVPHEEK